MPRWFVWTLVALGAWGLWAIASKLIGEALSPAQSQAVSTIGMLPVIAALALSRRPPATGRVHRGRAFAVLAGGVTCLGNIAYYAALQRGEKAATVVPLTALYPVITIGLAVLFLRERLHVYQQAGVLLSVVATYLFNVASESGMLSSAIVHAVPPIVLWGVSGLLQKVSTNHVSGETSALWFLAAFIPLGAVVAAWDPPLPGRLGLWVLFLAVALGLCFAFGNFAILAAFAAGGKASIIAPLGSLYPLVSVPIALLFLGERIGARETAGIAVAVLSVVALSLEFHQPPPDPACPPSINS